MEMFDKLQSIEHKLQSMRGTHEETLRELNEREEDLEDANAKIDVLEESLDVKTTELHEVQEMRQRLMAAMGIPTEVAPAPNPVRPSTEVSRRRSRRIPERTASERQKTGASPNKSFGSSTSSDKGPTPKRPKPRTTFKVPTIQRQSLQARSSTVIGKRMSMPASTRAPLEDVSGSRGNDLSRPSELLKANNHEKNQAVQDVCLEDLSLRDSDLFTSTPVLPQAFGVGQVEDEYDDTTRSL